MAIHRRCFIVVGDCTKSLATSNFAKRSFRSGHLPTKRQLTKPSKAKIEHHLLLALIARRPPWRQLSLQSYQQAHSMKATHAVPRCITGPALKPLRARSIPPCFARIATGLNPSLVEAASLPFMIHHSMMLHPSPVSPAHIRKQTFAWARCTDQAYHHQAVVSQFDVRVKGVKSLRPGWQSKRRAYLRLQQCDVTSCRVFKSSSHDCIPQGPRLSYISF